VVGVAAEVAAPAGAAARTAPDTPTSNAETPATGDRPRDRLPERAGGLDGDK
jgi:hypothetical protein